MRPPFSRVLAFAVSLAALPAAALAMMVPINHAQRIDLRGVAASVVVGNPRIASVTVVDAHTIYVMGLGPGLTNVAVLDRAGHSLFTGDVTVAATGANVSLYRGDKRTQVNCSYGCVEEAAGDTQASVGSRSSAAPPPGSPTGAAAGSMP